MRRSVLSRNLRLLGVNNVAVSDLLTLVTKSSRALCKRDVVRSRRMGSVMANPPQRRKRDVRGRRAADHGHLRRLAAAGRT
jgi:hypothetical protein